MNSRPWLRRRERDLELAGLAAGSWIPCWAIRRLMLVSAGMTLGPDAVVYHGVTVRAAKGVRVGARTTIGERAILDGRGGITIGDDVNLSTAVNIWTAQHSWKDPDFAYTRAAVSIGDHAWLSTRVIVLPGSVVGEGAVIGAGSVVSGEIPPWTLAVGQPARPIRDRPSGMTYRLAGSKGKAWWW